METRSLRWAVHWSGRLACLLLALAAGCSKKKKDDYLQSRFAKLPASYQILNLASGEVQAVDTIPDLASAARYRTTHMVFRLLPKATVQLGSPAGSFAAQTDEPLRQATLRHCYCGIYEVTQAQWRQLSGHTPWRDAVFVNQAPAVIEGDDLPAWGLSFDAVGAALATYAMRTGRHLELPTDDAWEHACRAGSRTVFSWGDSRDSQVVAFHAVVFETLDGDWGPRPVGRRAANAFGLYDMHGNVWELTASGIRRGGSWYDPVSLARSANSAAIPADASHALVGARLVYVP